MSCNGCRVLRKGCSENCILRTCLQWIESAEAQGHATVFVAKFFGRAGLMSFISAVPENQRPSLFQSLLYEAAGRTVNPVNGAVGLLWTGNWHVCQAAVETVLRGGALQPIPGGEEASQCTDTLKLQDPAQNARSKVQKRRRLPDGPPSVLQLADLDLSLNPGFQGFHTKGYGNTSPAPEKRRPGTPSMNSEESVTTTCFDSQFAGAGDQDGGEPKLLSLFN
nr:LOB domain-containing protein 37 [Ipomoea batatas]